MAKQGQSMSLPRASPTSSPSILRSQHNGSSSHTAASDHSASISHRGETKNIVALSTPKKPINGAPLRYNVAEIMRTPSKGKKFSEDVVIVNVWKDNLKEELNKMMDVLEEYPYIAMDTEFPGVVARPVGSFKNSHDYHYQTLKCNVDLLKIIQLGLSFCDSEGNLLPGVSTWQFNFKFSLSEDMYAQDSIDLLAKSGIDFKEHDARGIEIEEFGELLTTSGIVLNDNIKWISFHSGYDYGYLLKVLTCQVLPKEEADFFELLRIYFPVIYDIKYLMKSCENLKGGLQKVAEKLQVERIGREHQAGSDSLLTAATFFKMRSLFFENNIDDDKYMGVLFGLGQHLPREKEKEKEKKSKRIEGPTATTSGSGSGSTSSSTSSGSSSATSSAWA